MNLVVQLVLTLAVFAKKSSSFTTASCDRQHVLSEQRSSRIRLGASEDGTTPDMGDVGFVVLAGGTGSRMKAGMRELGRCREGCIISVFMVR